MAEFKPIETQEELDAFAGKIRKEAQERLEKKYADYEDLKSTNADLKEKLDAAEKAASESAKKYQDYDKNLEDLQTKVKGYELDALKTQVALAAGLPYEAAGRLRGETEEELKADAETFAGLMKPQSQPLADPEKSVSKTDSTRAAMRGMLQKMNNGGE